MESGTRKLKRKPLSDCTNINPSSRQPSLSTPKLKSNPINVPSPTFRPLNLVDAHCEQTPIANTYRRKQPVAKAEGKEKSVAVVPFSCPPAGRTKSIGSELETQQCETNKRNKEQSGVDLCKTYTIPRRKSKKVFFMLEGPIRNHFMSIGRICITNESQKSGGDGRSADLLETVVYPEEITHCVAGVKWFKYLCLRSRNPTLTPNVQEPGKDDETKTEIVPTSDGSSNEIEEVIQRFHSTVRNYFRGPLKPPFNEKARKAVGFGPQWYEPLAIKAPSSV